MMIKRVEALKRIAADRFNGLTLSRFNGDGSLDEWTQLLIVVEENLATLCCCVTGHIPARGITPPDQECLLNARRRETTRLLLRSLRVL